MEKFNVGKYVAELESRYEKPVKTKPILERSPKDAVRVENNRLTERIVEIYLEVKH